MLYHPRIIETYLLSVFHLLDDIMHPRIQIVPVGQIGWQVK